MYELTQDQALEVGGGWGDGPGTTEEPLGGLLDIRSGEVEELLPGYFVRTLGA